MSRNTGLRYIYICVTLLITADFMSAKVQLINAKPGYQQIVAHIAPAQNYINLSDNVELVVQYSYVNSISLMRGSGSKSLAF